ncbi:hypothetical protein CRG98_023206 [Punica granatum]|uniref:Retrotransposon gag domain-containing protein n=1 Tax=Punica granatum TaxID=22663 RepID=A0A2I0JKB9_PUNGR|nr:hypothetical protein CRG98_023206 [Punica granatum]
MSTVHPADLFQPQPTVPAVAPLPSMTVHVPAPTVFALPPQSVPIPATVYTAPPPTVLPTSNVSARAPIQSTETFPFLTLQSHGGLPYQFSQALNIPPPEPCTPSHVDPVASPAAFLPEAETEQERRIRRMEETIRPLQASKTRPDNNYGDCSLFPRSALDWFMSLRAEDILTWADLSRKFIDQYQYCTETPPTLLELSTKEMAHDQKFKEYATKWRAEAAKHIPSISEVQQIQLFHSTLRGVYYSHLLAHTSSFFDLIEARKKLDLGIKLGRMEGPTIKGEESAKKTSATPTSSSGRRGKEVPPPQGQSGGAVQSRPRRQYPSLPVPLSHIYQQLRASDKIGMVAPGPNFDPTIQDRSKQCEYHRGALGHTLDNCWKLQERIQEMIDAKELTFNAVRPPNVQANPLPDHGPSQGSSINMISICALGEDEGEQGGPSPFVIEYIPVEATVGFVGIGTPPTPFVIDIPV